LDDAEFQSPAPPPLSLTTLSQRRERVVRDRGGERKEEGRKSQRRRWEGWKEMRREEEEGEEGVGRCEERGRDGRK
jgi:hypothetical protein